LASKDSDRVAVLVWHYHDDDVPGPEADVNVEISGLAAAREATVTEYRIDSKYSNAYSAWQAMGSPQSPTEAQLRTLRAKGSLQRAGAPTRVSIVDGKASLRTGLPRLCTALFIVELSS
jgi:xylan 1,4-beta-xylosidase